MSLPLSFLLGLALLLAHDHVTGFLPGEAGLGDLLPFLPVLAVPALFAQWNGGRLRRLALAGRALPAGSQALVRAQFLVVPLSTWLLLERGLANLVEQWTPSSEFLQLLVLLSPLVAMDVSQRIVERRTARWFEWRGVDPGVSLPTGSLTMLVFVLVPILGFGLASEAVVLDRRAEVFLRATAIGSTIGLLGVVVVLCVALPLLFRFVLPLESRLPAHLEQDVHETAARLGFRRRNVLALHTGLKVVNAALVGPLPWPRYLLLTDGILTILDRYSLRGVVAHEVGHATAGHPGWLLLVFVVVPILLFHPIGALGLGAMSPEAATASGVAALAFAAIALRSISRRFEFEADQLSAEALGGAAPCIAALRRVGDLFVGHRGKGSFRHPSEDRRVENLLRLEDDPVFRAGFRTRGRRLRWVFLLLVAAALATSAWAHRATLDFDLAVYSMYTGDFGEARRRLDAIPDDALGIDPRTLAELRDEAGAARDLIGDSVDWSSERHRLADLSWARGVEVLERDGPSAARPWFALALARDAPTALERTIYMYCAAVAGEDRDRAAELRTHLRRLGAPDRIMAGLEPR